MIGYWLVQALDNVLECPVVALLTQTVVDAKDPAFDTPRNSSVVATRRKRRVGWAQESGRSEKTANSGAASFLRPSP